MKKYAIYIFVGVLTLFFVGNYIVNAGTEAKEKMTKKQQEITSQLANF